MILIYFQYSNYFTKESHRQHEEKVLQEQRIINNHDENANIKQQQLQEQLQQQQLQQQFKQQLEQKMLLEKQKELEKQQQPLIQQNNQKDKMLEILNKLERIIHIDLKGAPPKPEYFKEFIPLIKKYGATGILIEYEDMFPYTGRLEVVKHGNAYSKDDVKMILQLAKDNNLSVMPLVQTYGHLEWLLKHKNFSHLRENPEFPQVISPCIPESYEVILGNYFDPS